MNKLLVLLVTVCSLIVAAFYENDLVINRSASAQPGIYQFWKAPFEEGDLVLVCAPTNDITQLGLQRGYILSGVRCQDSGLLIKTISAVGPRVLDQGNNPLVTHDSLGRPLPSPSRPSSLNENEIWLHSNHPQSFDSRYFGPAYKKDVLGRVRLIWAF